MGEKGSVIMETVRIQNSQTERIEALALDSSGNPMTGLTDVLLRIRRTSDDYFLDFDDNTFKNSDWTDIDEVMAEINATNDAGRYKYDFDTSGFPDDTYEVRINCASAENFPQTGELKVGGYVNKIVTMRGTDGANTTTPPTVVQSRQEMDSNSTQLAAIVAGLARALGLSYENSYQHTRVYTSGKLTSVKIDLYDSKVNATIHNETTGIVAKYTLTQTHTGNELNTQLMVQDS